MSVLVSRFYSAPPLPLPWAPKLSIDSSSSRTVPAFTSLCPSDQSAARTVSAKLVKFPCPVLEMVKVGQIRLALSEGLKEYKERRLDLFTQVDSPFFSLASLLDEDRREVFFSTIAREFAEESPTLISLKICETTLKKLDNIALAMRGISTEDQAAVFEVLSDLRLFSRVNFDEGLYLGRGLDEDQTETLQIFPVHLRYLAFLDDKDRAALCRSLMAQKTLHNRTAAINLICKVSETLSGSISMFNNFAFANKFLKLKSSYEDLTLANEIYDLFEVLEVLPNKVRTVFLEKMVRGSNYRLGVLDALDDVLEDSSHVQVQALESYVVEELRKAQDALDLPWARRIAYSAMKWFVLPDDNEPSLFDMESKAVLDIVAVLEVDETSPKNPYYIHKRHLERVRSPGRFSFRLPVEEFGDNRFVWGVKTLRQKRVRYIVKDLPGSVNPDTLSKLLNNLRSRITPEMEAQVALMFSGNGEELTLDSLLLNLEGSKEIERLMNFEKGAPKDEIHPKEAFRLYKVLEHILNQSDVVAEGEYLSPRDFALLSFSYQVNECATGKGEKISDVFFALPNVSEERLGEAEVRVQRLLSSVYQEALAYTLKDPRFWVDLVGPEEVPELYHHIRYVKNSIAHLVGMNHSVTFDANTEVLLDGLVALSPAEITEVLFRHCTQRRVIRAFIKRANEELRREGSTLYADISAVLPTRASSLWVVNEEDSHPVLTGRFALELMKKLGFSKVPVRTQA